MATTTSLHKKLLSTLTKGKFKRIWPSGDGDWAADAMQRCAERRSFTAVNTLIGPRTKRRCPGNESSRATQIKRRPFSSFGEAGSTSRSMYDGDDMIYLSDDSRHFRHRLERVRQSLAPAAARNPLSQEGSDLPQDFDISREYLKQSLGQLNLLEDPGLRRKSIAQAIASPNGDEIFRLLHSISQSHTPLTSEDLLFAVRQCAAQRKLMLSKQIIDVAEHWRLAEPEIYLCHIAHLLKHDTLACAMAETKAMMLRGGKLDQSALATIIQMLIKRKCHQEAWDLFYDIRRFSYAQPDVILYNAMIEVCATAASPMPEQAIELFEQMQQDAITPTIETYTGLIKACMLVKPHLDEVQYLKGLDYMRQAVKSGLVPDRKMLHAILEGTKRRGDLRRALWIFHRLSTTLIPNELPNTETLSLVFDTYASFKPAVHRAPTETVAEPFLSTPAENVGDTVDKRSDTPLIVPRTSQEALNQIRSLMLQVLESNGIDGAGLFPFMNKARLTADISCSFKPTSQLLNAFCVAHGALATFAETHPLYETLFQRCSIRKTPTSFVNICEACERPANRELGLKLARKYFEEWRQSQINTPSRKTERIWTSLIRNLARNNLVKEAMQVVRAFRQACPPKVALPTQPPKSTELEALENIDDLQQPESCRLSFADVALLHKRLVDNEERASVMELRSILQEYNTEKKIVHA